LASLPRRLDPRRIDIASFIDRAVAETEDHEHQQRIVDLLRGPRDLNTLKAVAEVLRRRPGMAYDKTSLEKRARLRIKRAFSAVGHGDAGGADGPVVLEVGCGRAENASHVRACGASQYIGIDLNTSLVPEERRLQDGIEVVEASAENLPFANGTVDLAISFNVMEHVPDPQIAVYEIIRVLKPGGCFYTMFGPPFNASMGPHLTRFVDLPYVQHLFPERVVGDFTGRENPYLTVNRRSLSYYRNIFLPEQGFSISLYREHITGSGFWLLKAHRELKMEMSLEELGVSAITVLLRK
jgi:SAM-dependent methyltransferase